MLSTQLEIQVIGSVAKCGTQQNLFDASVDADEVFPQGWVTLFSIASILQTRFKLRVVLWTLFVERFLETMLSFLSRFAETWLEITIEFVVSAVPK